MSDSTEEASKPTAPFHICARCDTPSLRVSYFQPFRIVQTCSQCGHRHVSTPPVLDKRIIYLDQWVISGVAKALDPVTIKIKGTPSDADYWLALWDQLHRLVQLHIVVFPRSPIHQIESVVIPDYFSVHRAIYEHLAPNAEFYDPLVIFPKQVGKVYRSLRDAVEYPSTVLTRREALVANPNQWADHVMRLRIGARWGKVSDEIARARELRASADANLRSDAERWATQRKRSFKERFIEQQKIGTHAFTESVKLGPLGSIAGVAIDIFHDLRTRSTTLDEAQRAFNKFLASEPFLSVPYNQLSAALFAAIARKVAGGQRPDRINGGHWLDVSTIAAYAPYCDAMCVDGYFADLLLDADVTSYFRPFSCRFFSYQTKDAFLAYLKDLERTAPSGLTDTVAALFGDTWTAPYRTILEYARNRDKKTGYDKLL